MSLTLSAPVVYPSKGSINKYEALQLLLEHDIVKEEDGTPIKFSYGTAGFRYNAQFMPSVCARMGMFVALRSIILGQDVGLMITASHNDESYNGIKISDPDGGMMHPDGEKEAIRIANAATPREVIDMLQLTQQQPGGQIHVARDTRDHSPGLSQLVIRAAQSVGATVVDHGRLTTPQLHHIVRHANPHYLPNLIPIRPNAEGYFELACYSYVNLLRTCTAKNNGSTMWLVDCACGVGYHHVRYLNARIQKMVEHQNLKSCSSFVAINGPAHGPLNERCGAEFVQKSQKPPHIFGGPECNTIDLPFCSLDGDADRIVFHFRLPDEQDSFCLLDGDKIAVLICTFLKQEFDALEQGIGSKSKLRFGVVQTAYANGASTAYLKSLLGIESVLIAKTGVKYVHAAAHYYFDVGVYFEANGHGTVLFGDAFYDSLANAEKALRGQPRGRAHLALERLRLLPPLINQAVGDALCDMLLVDAILYIMQWNAVTWSKLYEDYPSRQCKVKVKNRE